MYYYYQDGEYTSWKVARSEPGLLEKLARQGAKKCTILAVSEIVEADTDTENLRHKGPLYFDVDCGEDLDQAANSTRALVDLLGEYGVEDQAIQVYASGSKGFHVIVPAKVFLDYVPSSAGS